MDASQQCSTVVIDSSDNSDAEESSSSQNTGDRCRVCGQKNAQMHYGALACVGCKGFFRRALKKADQLECLGSGKCTITQDARTNCRSCRLRKCLDAGMNPASVRPDRDFTGKQRKSKKTPERKLDDSSNDRIASNNDDWNKRLSVEMKTMLMRLLNIEAKIAKGDTNIEASKLYPLSVKTLKEMLEDPTSIKGKRSEMRYDCYRQCENYELTSIAYRRLIETIDWVEYLSEYFPKKLAMEDKIALVKGCFTRLLVFKVSARTAVNTNDENILCMCNFAYIPRDMSRIYNDCYHWNNGLIDRVLDEIVAPYRKFKLKEEEIVCLAAIVVLNPLCKDISEEASDMILNLRNKIQDTLYAVLKESRPRELASTLYGNILLSLPTVWTIANAMGENFVFAQTFSPLGSIPLMINLFGCFPVEPFGSSSPTTDPTEQGVQNLSLSGMKDKGVQTEYYLVRPQKKRSAPVTFTTPIEITNKRPFSLKHPPCAYTLTEMFEDLQSCVNDYSPTSSEERSTGASPSNPNSQESSNSDSKKTSQELIPLKSTTVPQIPLQSTTVPQEDQPSTSRGPAPFIQYPTGPIPNKRTYYNLGTGSGPSAGFAGPGPSASNPNLATYSTPTTYVNNPYANPPTSDVFAYPALPARYAQPQQVTYQNNGAPCQPFDYAQQPGPSLMVPQHQASGNTAGNYYNRQQLQKTHSFPAPSYPNKQQAYMNYMNQQPNTTMSNSMEQLNASFYLAPNDQSMNYQGQGLQ